MNSILPSFCCGLPFLCYRGGVAESRMHKKQGVRGILFGKLFSRFVSGLPVVALICCILLFSTGKAFTQTISTVESRCVNTGEIIISGVVGTGGPYQLSLVSYPATYTPGVPHFRLNLPDSFNSLYPGNYTLQVIDQAGSVFNYPDIVVPGSYNIPGNNSYNPVATGVTNCASGNGTIEGVLTAGRAPVQYRIATGPVQAGAVNSTGTFTGLVAGSYLVQATDSCGNIQSRTVVVPGYNSALSVTEAYISVINCTTFSLDSLKMAPSFPVGGRYEVINLNGSGGNVIRASGSSFPATFTLFSKSDIPNRRVRIRVFDACGNATVYLPLKYSNLPEFSILNVSVNRINCDTLSLDAVGATPLPGAGYQYAVYNLNPGPQAAITSSSMLPIRFRGKRADVKNGKVVVRIIDSCGDAMVSKSVDFIANDWELDASVVADCNNITVAGISFTGIAPAPFIATVKAFFTNSFGVGDSSAQQTITTLPYSISGIPANASNISTLVIVTDTCGETRSQADDFSFSLGIAGVTYGNCFSTTVELNTDGYLTPPISFTVTPSAGTTQTRPGVFSVQDGTYEFTATDSCGRTVTTPRQTYSRGWRISGAEQAALCIPGYITNRIAVPSRSIGSLRITQYAGPMPVTSGSAVLSSKTFISTANNCVICAPNATTGEWIQFDSTLAGATYTYIVADSCGKQDTVSLTNDSVAYRQFYHLSIARNKCINRGDIVASWKNDGPAWNNVIVGVFDNNNNQIVGYYTSGNSNLQQYPNGQTLLSDYPSGRYFVKYSFSNCSLEYIDTVIILAYVQPSVSTVQSLVACAGSGYPVIINGANGIAPYAYQIISSTPDALSFPAQSSSVFNLPGSQATVTVRVLDACLNSITKTIAVTRSAPPYIRSNPAVFAACTLPFNFSLVTDSVYAGAVFEWTKLTGTGAGPGIIGTRPTLPLQYNSTNDTGTYRVRVRVPGSCYDMQSDFTVDTVAISCLPGISGTVLNDANGLNDNTVNGPGVNAGALYATLVNNGGLVVQSVAVSSNGTYFFLDVTDGNYSVVVSAVQGVPGNAAPVAILPSGWVYTGEHIGALPGSDGTVNGTIAVQVNGAGITQVNFGINQKPVANDVTAAVQPNPGGTVSVTVPALNGSDAEDGQYDGVSGINTIVIQSLPSNGVLTYNGVPVVLGQVITQYNPALLQVNPNDGFITVTFTYSEVDAASTSSDPAQVTMVFNNVPIANTDSAFAAINEQVEIAVYVNDDYGLDGPLPGSITITVPPSHGVATVLDNGTPLDPADDEIQYTPANGYRGTDTLVYQICDSTLDCDTALVILVIGGSLPVTIIDFTATRADNKVLLQWKVGEAINVKEYQVLHSRNGIDFVLVGSIPATGASQYQFQHQQPVAGIHYYRLKAVDYDQQITYSKIVQVKLGSAAMAVQINPNPFADQITLTMALSEPAAVEAVLYDAKGRFICRYIFTGNRGVNGHQINNLSRLPKGNYVLAIRAGDQSAQAIIVRQ